jgi:hypothetical protein
VRANPQTIDPISALQVMPFTACVWLLVNVNPKPNGGVHF